MKGIFKFCLNCPIAHCTPSILHGTSKSKANAIIATPKPFSTPRSTCSTWKSKKSTLILKMIFKNSSNTSSNPNKKLPVQMRTVMKWPKSNRPWWCTHQFLSSTWTEKTGEKLSCQSTWTSTAQNMSGRCSRMKTMTKSTEPKQELTNWPND